MQPTSSDALTRLIDGNERFVKGELRIPDFANEALREQLVDGQEPFAIILGCSDSRAPAELIFDQGLGRLFVVRVAGNVVGPTQVGSIEFAVANFKTPLVVVLGHSCCGAVKTTYQLLANGESAPSRDLQSIVNQIKPAVEPFLNTDLNSDPDQLIELATRTNVSMTANQLRKSSSILEDKIASGELKIVGAQYSLETGKVDFFDGLTD